MSNLNNIVNINIDISQPAVDSASFDNLLIIGPPPLAVPPLPLPTVGAYSDLSEVVGAGYVAIGANADPIGVAARIAFSQSPRPSTIYITTVPEMAPTISGSVIKIITANNYLTDAIGAEATIPNPNDLPWLQVAYSRKAVSQMEITVEKDGVVVYGSAVPTTANPDAYFQAVIGTPLDPSEDALNIAQGEYAGMYTVTLTATDADGRVTTMTHSVAFDGAYKYTANDYVTSITPLASDVANALDAAIGTDGWYVACPAGIPESLYEGMAEWTEAQTKLFAYTFLSDTDPVGAVFYRSFGWCGLITDYDLPADVPQANSYTNVASAAKGLSYPAGSETWAFKRLASVYPSQLSSTLTKSLVNGHSNYFTQVAGRNITMNGQVRSGEWIDVIRGRDWMQNDMQLRIFNLMLMLAKLNYTNNDIALVQNEMIACLKAAQTRGIVAPDEFDEDGVLVPGFTVYVPNALGMTATQRASRILTGCMFSARLAGAIHAITVNGTLTY